jgi:hypothetical protein
MKRRDFLISAGAIGASGLSGCISTPVFSQNNISASQIEIPSYIIEESVFTDLSSESVEKEVAIDYRGESRDVVYKEWFYELSSENDTEKLWIRVSPYRKIDSKVLTPYEINGIRDAFEHTKLPWNSWTIESSEREYTVDITDVESDVNEYLGDVSTNNSVSTDVRLFYTSIDKSGDKIRVYGSVSEESGKYESCISVMQSMTHKP